MAQDTSYHGSHATARGSTTRQRAPGMNRRARALVSVCTPRQRHAHNTARDYLQNPEVSSAASMGMARMRPVLERAFKCKGGVVSVGPAGTCRDNQLCRQALVSQG